MTQPVDLSILDDSAPYAVPFYTDGVSADLYIPEEHRSEQEYLNTTNHYLPYVPQVMIQVVWDGAPALQIQYNKEGFWGTAEILPAGAARTPRVSNPITIPLTAGGGRVRLRTDTVSTGQAASASLTVIPTTGKNTTA